MFKKKQFYQWPTQQDRIGVNPMTFFVVRPHHYPLEIKVLIQDAEGFYDWAARSSMTNMTFKHDTVMLKM